MKRILDFDSFINESFFGFYLPFLFIPVDKNFKCVYSDLQSSNTPLPSERSNAGTAGYLLIPVTVECAQVLSGPYFRQPDKRTKVAVGYSKDTSKDGFIVMNGGKVDVNAVGSTGFAPVTAEVPGFGQQAAIYLKSGNAYIAELVMKKMEWEKEEVGNLKGKKISNGFGPNNYLAGHYYGGMDDAIAGLREILAASSNDLGITFEDEKIAQEYDVTTELLDLFTKNPGEFMTLNFPQEIFDKVSQMAKEKEPEQNISQTIDNLSDLKSGGFFDD